MIRDLAMKRYLQTLVLALAFAPLGLRAEAQQVNATSPEARCRYGLYYRVGASQSLTKAQPVLTAVEPYSSAAVGGLRAGDVIRSIDGVPTLGLSSHQVSELFVRPVVEHLIKIYRLGEGEKTLILRPECKAPEALTERELARAFADFSPQDQQRIHLNYPFVYYAEPGVAITGYRTFAFAQAAPETAETTSGLYTEISRLLQQRGLTPDGAHPDLIVSVSYALQPAAAGMRVGGEQKQSMRYLPSLGQVGALPIYPPSLGVQGEYTLQLRVQLALASQPDHILWSCESRDQLSDAMTIPDYAASVLPLMLQAFPYAPTATPAGYTISSSRYLYTGIQYDSRDLSRVVDVEEDSPAFTAGIRTGDRILAIDGKELAPTEVGAMVAAYRDFLGDTYKLRAAQDAVTGIRLWGEGNTSAVKKAFDKDKASSVFGYLFGFRPYIPVEKDKELTIDIEREGERYSLTLRPVLRDESTIIPD